MINNQEGEDLFRLVEEEVLDQHHRTNPLLSRNENEAIVAVLRVYGGVLRDLRAGPLSGKSNETKNQTANDGLRGMAHCLRWIAECCPSRLHVPTPPRDTLDKEALALLQWAVTYDTLWNQHSAKSRKLIDVQIDEPAKTITFLPNTDADPRFFCTQIEAKKADDERRAQACPEDQLAQLSSEWFNSVRPTHGGLHFDDSAICRSEALDVATAWIEEICLSELPSETTLGRYTVADLRRLLATIYVYALYVTRLEDCSDDQPVHGVKVESHLIMRSRSEMIGWLRDLSGVDHTAVDEVISTLTFDPEDPHVTVAQQPFVSSKNGTMLFLPRMILFLNLSWMYVGALNRTKAGEKVYSKAINEIERNGVKRLVEELRQHDSGEVQITERKRFRLQDGRTIEPDIVALSAAQHELLVMDVKYASPPFGPANIHRDIEEIEKWITRMAEYLEPFCTDPGLVNQHFSNLPQEADLAVFGLIVLRWPFPVPADFPSGIFAVDWPSLRNFVEEAGAIRIREIMDWALRRQDVQVPPDLCWKCKEVHVAEWTYRYSVLAPAGCESE